MTPDLSRYVVPLAEALQYADEPMHPRGAEKYAERLLAPGGIIDRIVTEALAEQRARIEKLGEKWEERAALHGSSRHSMLAFFYEQRTEELRAALDPDTTGGDRDLDSGS